MMPFRPSSRPPQPRHRHARASSSSMAALAALTLGVTGLAAAAQAAGPAEPASTPGQEGSALFGPNVTVFDSSWTTDQINALLQGTSHETEFSQNRHQFFFAPGAYGDGSGADDPATATGIVNSELGYYQAVGGLGASPEDVVLNGAIHVEPFRACEANPWDCQSPGSLNNFWRSLSNMTINPIQQPVGIDADRDFPSGIANGPHWFRYSVSQASPMRRMNIEGSLTLMGRVGEYASGGYLANTKVSGTVQSGSQQQWYTRNSEVGAWDGGVWNMVFSGVAGAPATNFGGTDLTGAGADRSITNVATTPVSREAPFLYVSASDPAAADPADAGSYSVFVPNARTDSTGVDWSTSPDAGASIPLADFHIAQPGDSAATINQALAAGQNLLLTPGVYHLSDSLHVDRADAVVLGLGMATLTPDAGTAALEIGDVPGVKVAGLTIDAGTTRSDVLVRVGTPCATPDDASATDPTTLTDVFIRVGGAWAGRAATSIEVNADHTLLDHIWAWRADHGDGVGWDQNTADHGLVVNGDDVTATGLFVEHYQKNQVLWNGNGGQTVFYQSELPYDPPTQADWMDGAANGYASYRVADDVVTHHATGLGVYSFFDPTRISEPSVADTAIQVPATPGVSITSAVTKFLNGVGGIESIVNDQGGAVSQSPVDTRYLPSYATAGEPVDPPAPAPDPSCDVTAPVVSADVDEDARVVALTATDDLSGVASIEYALGEGEGGWTAYTAPVTVPDDVATLRYRATDNARNVSEIGTVDLGVVAPPSPQPTPSTSTDPGTGAPPSSSPSADADLARTGTGAGLAGAAALALLGAGGAALAVLRRLHQER